MKRDKTFGIYVPSYKRYDCIKTDKVLNDCTYVVRESEEAVILLCTQPHSRDADVLSNFVYDRKRGLTDDQINAYMEEARNENIPIPDYAYDVHTRQGKMKGKTKADFFIEEDQSLAYRQLSLFDDINIGVM